MFVDQTGFVMKKKLNQRLCGQFIQKWSCEFTNASRRELYCIWIFVSG